jgi:hypothetical protein
MCKNSIIKLGLGLIFVVPLGLYFYVFHGVMSVDHSRWAEFGSYVSGIYGALAFLILTYTTYITRKQFKVQNEDNIFFRLYESLQNRINTSSAIIDNENHTAHQVLKLVVNRFYEELSKQSIEIARLLLCNTPEKISNTHYIKIFQAINGNKAIHTFQQDQDNFITDMNSQKDFNAKWERLKYYIGSRYEEGDAVREALRATGRVNFYKLPFEERRQHYNTAVQSLSKEYGELLDGYYKNIAFLVQYAAEASNKKIYMDFIKSQLSKYELIILFYLIAGNQEDTEKFREFKNNGIFDGMFKVGCQSLMIDCPSIEIIKQEIEFIFGEG